MADSTSRSVALLRSVGGLLRRDPSLLLFALLLGGGVGLFIVAWAVLFAWLSPERAGLVLLLVFGLVLGISFITTFFRTAIVVATRAHLAGQPIGVATALSQAHEQGHVLAYWALFSATVTIVLSSQDSHGFIEALPRVVWWAATAFVLPAIVYKKLAIVGAIQESVQVLQRAWFEVVAGAFALVIVRGVFVLIGLVLLAGLPEAIASGTPLNAFRDVLLAVYFLSVVAISELVEQVYETLIYDWVTTGRDPAA